MSTETHSFEDGKYTLVNNHGILTALRHGEPWPAGTAALVGDGLTLAMFHSYDELSRKLAALEAELYAAQDQVAGLQELMRTQRAPENLDVAVRHLVAAAEADDCHQGSPEHGHRLAGRWDGDNKHPKGSPCEECAAWDILRKYVATDVAAEAQVIEDARVTQLLATLKRADGIISMLMPGAAKAFNLDIMELNEGMMEIAQALANEKGSAQ